MMRPGRRKYLPAILVVLALMMAVGAPIRGSAVEVHDIATVNSPGQEVKCGCSTCGNPCYVQPPPPPTTPPPPSPPPKGPSVFCPPPPKLYFFGPPADLYPVDPGYASAGPRGSSPVGLPVVLACGFLRIWWL